MELQELCSFLRGGPAPAGYDPKGLAIYKKMVVNNIAGMVAVTVPGIRDQLPREDWLELIEDFISKSNFTNPVIVDIRKDFRTYIQKEINNV